MRDVFFLSLKVAFVPSFRRILVRTHLFIYLSIYTFISTRLFIQGVYILTSEVSSLVCTLVVTLRKFFSLLFSIYYFENPFSVYHWIGTSLVFGGTVIFLDLINMIRNQLFRSDKDDASTAPPATTDNVADETKYTEIKKKE